MHLCIFIIAHAVAKMQFKQAILYYAYSCLPSSICTVVFQIIGILVDIESMKEEYDQMITNLLQWIEQTIARLSDRTFPNSLPGMQKLMTDFKTFRTMEKPPK